MPPSALDIRGQNTNAYALTAIAGLLFLAMHAMGLGVVSPGQVLNEHALTYAFPEIWPYLVLALGLFAKRRWARDLASPTAYLALVEALAALPRYLFLNLGYNLESASAHAHSPWSIFRPMLAQQAVFIALCAGTFYALTRPSLVAQCRIDPKQPAWTEGLGFAALLPLSRQFFTASGALNFALYKFPDWAALHPIDWKALEPCAMAALALTALVGLWKRRWWGWLAMCAQTLLLLCELMQTSLAKALASFYQFQYKAPSAASLWAGEAFCRSLPDLAVLLCVLVALLKSRRTFRL